MLLVMSLHPRGSQSIFQVFQAVVTDFTKATAWKVAQTTPVLLHPFKNVLLEFTEGFQMDSLFTPFQFPHKQTGWCTGALTLFILPLQFSLQAPCGLCRCVSSWVISAGCQGRATSGMALHCQGQGAARERRATGTWKTHGLGQKERTPLGNLWMWRMNWNRYCLWGILLCTTLKAMKFLST